MPFIIPTFLVRIFPAESIKPFINIPCAFSKSFSLLGLNNCNCSYTLITFWPSTISFCSASTLLLSKIAVICSSESVFPSISSEG